MQRKKYLGQNFLSNNNILNALADAAELTAKDTVLEAGPGLGSLTEILARRAKKVIAVEKDGDLIPILRQKFKNIKNVKILEGDILTSPLTPLLRKERGFKIVANIPYYITSHFLRLFLTQTRFRSRLMVLMIQREVADRILAKDGKESLLSLSVKAYATAKIIRNVPKGAFSPPPKVDSAIIKITPFTGKGINPEQILSLARLAFQKKRKMLRQSIGNKIKLPEKFETMRPEELSLENWVEILLTGSDPVSVSGPRKI